MSKIPGVSIGQTAAGIPGMTVGQSPSEGVVPGIPGIPSYVAVEKEEAVENTNNDNGGNNMEKNFAGAQQQAGASVGTGAQDYYGGPSFGGPAYGAPMGGVIIPKSYGKMITMKMSLGWDEVKDFINTAITIPHTVDWQQIIPQVFFGKLLQEGKTKEEAATICSKLMMLPLYATDANGNILRNPTNPQEVLYFVESNNATQPIVAPIIRFRKETVQKGTGASMNIYEMMAGGKDIDLQLLKTACAKVVAQEDLPCRVDNIEGTVDVFCNLLGVVADMLVSYGLDRTSFGREVEKWSIQASSRREDQAIIVEVARNAYKGR